MFLNNLNDISEAQNIRQKKNTLKYLKQAFETQKTQFQKKELKPKGDLEQMISKMKVQKLKQVFYKKITLNNVYQSARKVQLLNDQEINHKRLIKWKGFKLHQHLLSVIYIMEILFLVITFYISTCIAFLPNFIDSGTHNSPVVIGLNAATALLSCMKIGITSTSQTIKKGIMLIYITDIFIAYARSLILFVDLIYLIIIISLFILRIASSEITNLGVALFIWSIIRISISNQNLTYFRTTFLNSFKKEQYYKLFKVILFNFIFAHFVASMLLAMSEIDENQNWMISMHIYHEVWYVQYMWSYYWATTIMMTVGFGDFLPVTYKEGFIVSLVEFFSCIVLAYNISEIGGIISTIRASRDEYIAKMGVFKRMAEQNLVDLQLKIRIQDYLREEKAIKQRFEFNQQAKLLESLPQPLRKEFIMASNGKIFAFIPFFKGLHRNTLMHLTQIFKSKVYYPGQILSKANEYNDSINILKDGKVGMTYRKENSCFNGIVVQQIQILNRECLNEVGQFVNIMCPILLNTEFLSPGKVVNYDMNALTYSYVFQLGRVQFMTAIKTSEIDSQYFFSLIHSTTLGKSGWEQLPCEQCEITFGKDFQYAKTTNKYVAAAANQNRQLYFHTKFQCPRLHYQPTKGIIIMRYNRTLSQVQISKPNYKRKKDRTQSCLLFRRKAFKIYEKKRFINEKKDFQKFVQKSISYKSIKNYLKPKKQFSQFRKEKNRKHSDGNYENLIKKIHFNESICQYEYEKTEQLANSYCDPANEVSESQNDEQRTIIESVVKFAIDEVYPRNISLIFWNLEIDLMWNFINYFPQCNSVRLDNVELIKNKVYKNKALCVVGEIMKSYAETNSLNLRKYNKVYSMYQEKLNDEGIDNDNCYIRKSSMQIDLQRYKNEDYLENQEKKRMRLINSSESIDPLIIPCVNRFPTKKFLKIYSASHKYIQGQRQQQLNVIINPSTRKIDEQDSLKQSRGQMHQQDSLNQIL